MITVGLDANERLFLKTYNVCLKTTTTTTLDLGRLAFVWISANLQLFSITVIVKVHLSALDLHTTGNYSNNHLLPVSFLFLLPWTMQSLHSETKYWFLYF